MTLLKFYYNDWCAPCATLGAKLDIVLAELPADKRPVVRVINVDTADAIVLVGGVPKLILQDSHGDTLGRIVGDVDIAKLRQFLTTGSSELPAG